MKTEKEITVQVTCDYETLHQHLKDFKITETFQLDDIYLVPNNIDLNNTPVLEILSKCVLIRKIDTKEKTLTYKYKKYNHNHEILEQEKIDCPITNIEDALKFMQAIGYKRLFDINDKIIVYNKNDIEFAVQLVNEKYIFIEMEDQNYSNDKYYETIEEMITTLNSLSIDFDHSNYFVQKAEIIFNERYPKANKEER